MHTSTYLVATIALFLPLISGGPARLPAEGQGLGSAFQVAGPGAPGGLGSSNSKPASGNDVQVGEAPGSIDKVGGPVGGVGAPGVGALEGVNKKAGSFFGDAEGGEGSAIGAPLGGGEGSKEAAPQDGLY